MYSPIAMDHFLKPRHAGTLTGPGVCSGSATNADCGDTARFTVRIAGGAVAELAFASNGCAGAIAACSATAQWLAAKPLPAALALNAAAIEGILAPWPASKRGCTQMAVTAALAALAQANPC